MMNARYAISNMLQCTGVNERALNMRRNSLAVLCYHRVLDSDDPARAISHPSLVTSTNVFEQQMEIISHNFRPITLVEAMSWLDGCTEILQNAVLITFDDGWIDTYANAFPIMKRLGIAGTVFLATAFIGTNRRQWADAAYESIAAHEGVISALREVDRLKAIPLRLRSEALSNIDVSQIENSQNLTWPQINEMAARGFEFGSHTRNHLILPCEPEADIKSELRLSSVDIKNELGVEPMAFAYPDGQYDPNVAQMVDDAGYKIAFTCDEGLVSQNNLRFILPRLSIHDGISTDCNGDFSRAMFLTYLAGTIPWRYRRRVG